MDDAHAQTAGGVDVGPLTRASLTTYACANPDCYKITLVGRLYRRDALEANMNILGKRIREWPIIPRSRGRAFPDYVPAFVLEDYLEACETESISPKASATLSRRCLQSIIRDFFGVSTGNLKEEILAVEARLHDSALSAALHALREIGNVGAHPERDPKLIVDIEPGEARTMIDLIEIVIDETYIARREREDKIAKATAIAAKKEAAKALTSEASGK